jgi:hypothetical protein
MWDPLCGYRTLLGGHRREACRLLRGLTVHGISRWLLRNDVQNTNSEIVLHKAPLSGLGLVRILRKAPSTLTLQTGHYPDP